MGASLSKNQPTKQQRKIKSNKIAQSCSPRIEKPPMIKMENVGIDLYTSGITPSILIRDHIADQPLSSLFPTDIPYASSFNSSTVSTVSDLFSTASVETPNSTLSTASNNKKSLAGPSFGVARLNNQSHVAQHSKDGFNHLYSLATEHNNVDAYYPLGECYYWGYHHPSGLPDKHQAYTWFFKTTKANCVSVSTIAWAQYRLACLLAQGEGCDRNMDLAVQYLEQSANSDNRYAQYMLGLHYQHGLIRPDLQRALHYYEQSARNGWVEAKVACGQLILEHLATVDQIQWTELAIHWLELAAKQDNIKAHVILGGLYDEGQLVERDPTKAIQHYKAAAIDDSDHPQAILAHHLVGIHCRLGTDNTRAFHHFTMAAKHNYAPSQRALGLLYLQGVPYDRDEQKAHDWLTKAAAQGDIQALGILGQQVEEQHVDQAIALYKQAGSVAAQLSLGTLLLKTRRRAEAFVWFKRAATNPSSLGIGHSRQRNLARLMVARYTLNGWDDIKMDKAWAYEEFKQLADMENLVDAQFWVGACYEEGITDVVERDLQSAYEYYLKSAQGGDLDGQFQVALMLANGTGIDKDQNEAFKWYTKAADRGHPTAQYSLGLYYEHRLDLINARHWYERASHQQHTTAMIALAQLLLHKDSNHHQEALHWLHTAVKQKDDKNHTAALRALASVFEQAKIQVSSDRYQKGWLLLQKAANDPLAWVDMARYHEYGLGRPKSCVEALACLAQAQVLGYQKAPMAIGDLYYRHQMWTKAHEYYQKVVDDNALLNKQGWKARLAIARLGLIEGYDSDNTIYDWLVTMVAQPAPESVLMEPLELLGMCYEYGKYTNQDIGSAMKCYQRVSKIPPTKEMNWIQERTRFRLVELYMQNSNDHSLAWEQLQITKTHFDVMNHQCKSSRTLARTARFYIGYLLFHMQELKSRSDQAQEWLTQASDEGDGNAALELAKLHESNHDFDLCKQRLEQGVSASHSGCMVALALMMVDDRRLELLERAAELDHAPALYHLGRLVYEAYLDDPTPQLFDSALDYYMKAAAKGDERSTRRIGQIYDALEQYEKALIWFEQTPNDCFSRAWLIKYHLKDNVHDLIHATETIWLEASRLDRMDRITLSQLYLHLAPFDNLYLHRAHDLEPTPASTYSLGLAAHNDGDYIRAMDYFRTGAERWNHAGSQYKLGYYHANGLGGLEINYVAAQRYLSLAQDDEPEAKQELGRVCWQHANELWQEKQYQRGFKQYERAADQFLVPEACVALGDLYHTGFESSDVLFIVPKSSRQAFAYYSQAVYYHQDPQAALKLGACYEQGDTINLKEALTWYEKAYRWKGGAQAELAIGRVKHQLAVQEIDVDLDEEAFTWFEGAMSTTEAQVWVALYHLNGWGKNRTKDEQRGLDMLVRIDSVLAWPHIATCFENQGDRVRALVYWEKAAEMGNLLACRRAQRICRALGHLAKADGYGRQADLIERMKLNEREKSFCSATSSSSSYCSRRSSLASIH